MWGRHQLLYGLAVALVAAAYLGAEHGVRKAVYPPLDDKTRARAMQTVMESMPAFLRSALERHGRIQRLRERLAAATAADPYFKAVYELAKELDAGDTRRLYAVAMERYPTAPQGLDAVIALLGGDHPAWAPAAFAAYADRGDAAFQAQAWARGWGALGQAPEAVRTGFLDELDRRGVIAPGLEGAYLLLEWRYVKEKRMREADQAMSRQAACRAAAPGPNRG